MQARSTKKLKINSRGFTLVEIIIGIVVFALSLSVITSLILPTAKQSADQLQQIRAAELGQSLMNEILAKSFDENSDRVGGKYRCNENNAFAVMVDCTDINVLDDNFPDDAGELTRADFDDVDDYEGWERGGENPPIESVQGESLGTSYQGFKVLVEVNYDSNYDGQILGVPNDNQTANQTAKLITITVTTPSGDNINFSSYKANF